MSLRDNINIDEIKIETLLLESKTEKTEKSYYTYSGELNDKNKPNGYGIGIFSNFKYCGSWVDGLQNGEGIKYCTQENGLLQIKYVGTFNGAMMQGEGNIFINNYLYYDGNFVDNKYSGIGKIYYNNKKLRYYGNFKNNLREGNGKMYNKLGNIIFEGNFKEDKRSGNGRYYDTKFSSITPIYSGEWNNDMYNGVGILYSNLNNYYSGNFVDNKKHGTGKLYNDNSLYEGEFKNDKKNGIGKLTIFSKNSNRHSCIYEGNFINDVLVGYGKCYYKNGDIYEGNLENYKKEGFGIYICNKSKNKYEGNWKDDLKDGNITLTTDENEVFKTIWKKGKQINIKKYRSNFEEIEEPIKKQRIGIPIEYKCPITLFIMKNPVIASDGNTYERSSLEDLFKEQDMVNSPLTRELLDKNILIPNKNIKKLIDDLLIENPLILHM